MPTTSIGLYRWLFRGSAALEDFADRLNHIWTCGLLLLFACIISWKYGYNKPINCWCPAEFPMQHVSFTESQCWNSHIIRYPRNFEKAANELDIDNKKLELHEMMNSEGLIWIDDKPPTNESLLIERMATTVTLYQFLPVILAIQALLFKLPFIVMYIFHSYTGISFDKIFGLTTGYEHLNIQERQELGKQIARYVYRWCKQFGNLPWRFLTALWLIVKVLYAVNVVVQLNLIDAYTRTTDPPLDNSTSYGDVIVGNLFKNNATVWKQSPAFPRRVRCGFKIRFYQSVHRYSISCHLPANSFNEFAYMFIWVWLVFVAVVTCASLFVWLLKTLIPLPRKRYVLNAVELNDLDTESYSRYDVDKICDLLGEDGVMILKLISANSSELLVSDIVCHMLAMKSSDQAIRRGIRTEPPIHAVNVPPEHVQLIAAHPVAKKAD